MGCHFIYNNGGRARFHSLCMRWNSLARWQLLRNACFSRPRRHGRHCCKWNAWNSRGWKERKLTLCHRSRDFEHVKIHAHVLDSLFTLFFSSFYSSNLIFLCLFELFSNKAMLTVTLLARDCFICCIASCHTFNRGLRSSARYRPGNRCHWFPVVESHQG